MNDKEEFYSILPSVRGCIRKRTGLHVILHRTNDKRYCSNDLRIKDGDLDAQFEAWEALQRKSDDYESPILPKRIVVDNRLVEVKIYGDAVVENTYQRPGKIDGAELNLKGRVALVTGAAQGFGFHIAGYLLESGYRVFINDINGIALDEAVRQYREQYSEDSVFPLPGDVSREADVESICRTMVEQAGGIDLCVSNAGILNASGIMDEDISAFIRVTEVNYIAFAVIVKHVSRIMYQQYLSDGRSFYAVSKNRKGPGSKNNSGCEKIL